MASPLAAAPPQPHPARIYLVPLVVALALGLPRLWEGGWSTDTPWYSAIALNAFRAAADGDIAALWSLPGIGGRSTALDGVGQGQYFNKPPLAFWINGLPLWAMGATVLAARLGSLVAVLVSVGTLTWIARRASPSEVSASLGTTAGLVLALAWEFGRHGRSFSLDLWLVACLLIGLAGVVQAATTGSGRWLLLLGVGIGLSLLVKPLVGLLAIPIVAAWIIWDRRREDQRHWLSWLAAAAIVAIAVSAPWHLSMLSLHGAAFSDQYFGREIADRASGSGVVLNTAAADSFFYIGLLLKAYWPWLPIAGLAFAGCFARSTPPWARSWLRFAVLWSCVWLVALSLFADKRPRYALVLYPVLAWSCAIWLVALAPESLQRLWRRIVQLAAPTAAVIGLAIALVPGIRMHRPDPPQWAALFAHLDALGNRDLHVGALDGQRAARLYLHSGKWPSPTADLPGVKAASPPRGALLLYHRRDRRAPGRGETILWSMDDLTLTRLDADAWHPIAIDDPGE